MKVKIKDQPHLKEALRGKTGYAERMPHSVAKPLYYRVLLEEKDKDGETVTALLNEDEFTRIRHNHDCSKCVFIGFTERYDVYFCTSVERTFILRFGDEPSDYISRSLRNAIKDHDKDLPPYDTILYEPITLED